MRMISLLLMLFVSGCSGRLVARETENETETARCYAASELALFSPRDAKPIDNQPKPASCKCNGTKYVNERRNGKLVRIQCPCGQSCKCIGAAQPTAAEILKQPPIVILYSASWCGPCKPIMADLAARRDGLEFTLDIQLNDATRPDWVESLPTFYWTVGDNQWRKFVISESRPWPGVDGFLAMWRASFPVPPKATGPPAGVSAGKFPIRATVQQIKQLLSAKGLALPYGMSVKCPTGGLVASVSQAGQDVLIEFDESALPAVSFNGKVRRAVLGEQRGSIVIDGLPDVTFEVTQ